MATILHSNYVAAIVLAAIVSTVAFGAAIVNVQQSTPNAQTSVSAINSCDTRPFATNIASQVEQSPQFMAASASGSNWLLTYAGNESGFVSNATYTRQIHDTALDFYSFTSASAAHCNWDDAQVVNAIFVKIPINSDGSYNLSGLTLYSEPFHSNATLPAGVGK